jgi:antitoxin component of RelBE/YafQ-DinJ toxin-antitoxin module
MKKAHLYFKCKPEDLQRLKQTLAKEELSIAEAIRLYIAHLAVTDLPFFYDTDRRLRTRTKQTTQRVVIAVNRLHKQRFADFCKRFNMTQQYVIEMFVRYCLQHNEPPILFHPQARTLNEVVRVPPKSKKIA